MSRAEQIRSKNSAMQLIRAVTKETEAEQIEKYNHDPIYHKVVDQIASMAYLIATNRNFQEEQRMSYFEMKHLIKSIEQQPISLDSLGEMK